MKPENVGALFALVVCTVAVLLDTLPICVDPFFVVSANVPVNDFMFTICERSVVRCAEVRAIVLLVVPVLDCAGMVMVKMVMLPFLTASEYVKAVEYTVQLKAKFTVALSAVKVETLFSTAGPRVLMVVLPEVPYT